MALHPDFPDSPYEVLSPEVRWFPAAEEMRQILALHFPDFSGAVVDAAIKIFYELRGRGFEKAPATSELIEWLGAIKQGGFTPEEIEKVPLSGILLKRTADILSFRGEKRVRGG